MALYPLTLVVDLKLASSLRFALPKIIAPSDRSFSTIGALFLGTWFFKATLPAVVGKKLVSMLSLRRTGTPYKMPFWSILYSLSLMAASFKAFGFIEITAFSVGFCFLILSK